jgi:hypothetical protein
VKERARQKGVCEYEKEKEKDRGIERERKQDAKMENSGEKRSKEREER